MEHTTEHFMPAFTSLPEFEVNMERYLFAAQFLAGKTVLDLGTGCGLGAYIYSLFAKKVITVDYDARALEEARLWPFPHANVEFVLGDLRDPAFEEKLPETDVCVALEVLEHIEEPAALLRALKAKRLVFGLPLYSMEVSSWHRYRIEGERDVRALIQPFYDIGQYREQKHPKLGGTWMLGEGIRFTGN